MITDRIDAITHMPPEYRTACPPCPRSVKIELTARCDFKCFFCATGFRLRERGDMDPALLFRLLAHFLQIVRVDLGARRGRRPCRDSLWPPSKRSSSWPTSPSTRAAFRTMVSCAFLADGLSGPKRPVCTSSTSPSISVTGVRHS